MPPPYVPVEAGALPVATELAPDDVVFLLSPTLGLRKAAASAFQGPEGGMEEAPNDGTQYVRKSEAWAAFAIPSHVHNTTYFTKEEINAFGVGLPEGVLTDALSVTWDAQAAPAASLTITANRILENPTNVASGRVYLLRVIQDGVGSHSLQFGISYKWRNGTPFELTPAPGSVDILTFYCDGTNLYGIAQDNFV